jgi:hypothetical protein
VTSNQPTDLNELRRIIHEQQRRKEPYPTDPGRQITVTRTGGIQIGAQHTGSAPVSRVQQGTFAGEPGESFAERQGASVVTSTSLTPVVSGVVAKRHSTTAADLDELRARIRAYSDFAAGASAPVVVDRSGQIVLPATDESETGPAVSRVQAGTFAATRLEQDQLIARTKLPPNTVYIDDPDAKGWCYSITTDLGDDYTLFAYFTGSDYQVRLIAPADEGKYDTHGAHLYKDGRICLSDDPGSGQPSLEEAYSKSVIWALGFGFHKRGLKFPFSINNLND